MSEPRERSFAEILSSAQHARSRYLRLLLRRAYRAARIWLRRHVAARALPLGAYDVVEVSRARHVPPAR